MRIDYPLILIVLVLSSLTTKAESMDEYQGLKIQFDENKYKETKTIQIDGLFAIFVNCGSQYAIWSQFSETIRYMLKDLDTGEVFMSIDNELSISWDGNQVYESYSREPCGKVIDKEFSIKLKDIYFLEPPEKSISNFELTAYYMHESNKLTFKNTPLVLKGL